MPLLDMEDRCMGGRGGNSLGTRLATAGVTKSEYDNWQRSYEKGESLFDADTRLALAGKTFSVNSEAQQREIEKAGGYANYVRQEKQRRRKT